MHGVSLAILWVTWTVLTEIPPPLLSKVVSPLLPSLQTLVI